MPLYTYECECERKFERVLPVSMCDDPQVCPVCGRYAKKTIEWGHGGIIRTGDAVQWVKDAALTLDSDKPIETIQDLRNFYREHPNVRPVESHPALPSSYGDALDGKPDPVVEKKKRSKKGHELLRKMRSIEVGGRA